MFYNVVDIYFRGERKEIKGRVVLMKKYVLDFNDFNVLIIDVFDELLGKKVFF